MEGAEVVAQSPIVGSRVPRVAVLILRAHLHPLAARKADIVRPFSCNSRVGLCGPLLILIRLLIARFFF